MTVVRVRLLVIVPGVFVIEEARRDEREVEVRTGDIDLERPVAKKGERRQDCDKQRKVLDTRVERTRAVPRQSPEASHRNEG